MIFPGKYEDISKSFLVLSYRIILLVKKEDIHILKLYKKINKKYGIDLLYYFDILTFLWILNIIKLNFNIISLNNDLKKNLHNSGSV